MCLKQALRLALGGLLLLSTIVYAKPIEEDKPTLAYEDLFVKAPISPPDAQNSLVQPRKPVLGSGTQVGVESARTVVANRFRLTDEQRHIREHAIETLASLGYSASFIDCVQDIESDWNPLAYNPRDTDGLPKFTHWQYDIPTWVDGERLMGQDLDIKNPYDANLMTAAYWQAGQTWRWPSYRRCGGV